MKLFKRCKKESLRDVKITVKKYLNLKKENVVKINGFYRFELENLLKVTEND